jgi:hypothetical protein
MSPSEPQALYYETKYLRVVLVCLKNGYHVARSQIELKIKVLALYDISS